MKYKVIVNRTLSMVREIEANTEAEAIEKAWETDPIKWEISHLSDECEQYDVIDSDSNEWHYW
jgi:hypothetical protein